jgi:hypothetical protein
VSADDWQAARLLALLSIAMADGVIASFETKFGANFWRPITAIRSGDDDGNAATRGDARWEPLCVTPPFPEHNSIHAVVAAAAATILTRELGDRHTFTVDSPIGVSRTFTRFSDAPDEEAISRIYCGIHFRNGMNAGLAQGKAVAQHVFESLLRPVGYAHASAHTSPATLRRQLLSLPMRVGEEAVRASIALIKEAFQVSSAIGM